MSTTNSWSRGTATQLNTVGHSRLRHEEGPSVAMLLLALIIGGGTLGYMWTEGWTAWDAFYMTICTLTTVGSRRVDELSDPGQALTVLLLVAGVGTALYALTWVTSMVLEGGLRNRLERGHDERVLRTVSDHCIVCGYGRVGRLVAGQLQQQGVAVVIVERQVERALACHDAGFTAIQGDASHEDILKHAGIDRAHALIATSRSDAENVYTVLTARVLAPKLFLVSRAESDQSIIKLQRAGADRVISPYQFGAIQMAQTAVRPAVVDFVSIATSAASVELTLEEICVAGAASLSNHSLRDSNLRRRFGVMVVGIQHHNGHFEFNPDPTTVIHADDNLILLGRPESLRQLEAELSPSPSRSAWPHWTAVGPRR